MRRAGRVIIDLNKLITALNVIPNRRKGINDFILSNINTKYHAKRFIYLLFPIFFVYKSCITEMVMPAFYF